MKTRLISGTALAVIIAASGAYAADLGVPPARPFVPPLPPPPVFSWTGCYAGTGGGLATGQNKFSDTAPDGNIDGLSLGRTANTDLSGGVAGGQIGCDYQFAGPWVVGIAGSANWADIRGTNQDQFNAPWTLSDKIDWYATVTARGGYSVNNILLYVKGGAAWSHNNFEVENTGVTLGTPTDTRLGFTIGSGLEWAFAPHVSVFIEGAFYGFQSRTETLNFVPGFINQPTTINVKPSFETLTVGVNYRFGPW